MPSPPSSLRLGLLAGLVALAACDATDPAATPPAFTVAVVANGDTLATADAEPAASLADVAAASVRLAPRLGEPDDPALRGRYEAMQTTVAVLNAAPGDERYEVGHYLVATEADAAGAVVVTDPLFCEDTDLSLSLGDARLDAPGALFFPVLEGAAAGPLVTFRPFAVGGAGRLAFEGDGETATVEAPALAATPALVTAVISEAEVVVRRGTSAAGVTALLRRGATVRGGEAEPADDRSEITLPAGDGAAQIYLLESADDAATCPVAS